MLMGISDVLALARNPQEREEMRQHILKNLLDFDDSHIDFSDIPEITDFSRFVRGKPYIDKIREHNLRIEAERKQAALTK